MAKQTYTGWFDESEGNPMGGRPSERGQTRMLRNAMALLEGPPTPS
jgi:hypothetical protein